jgi:16S rRNA (guanine527-N7)-methyltransferase
MAAFPAIEVTLLDSVAKKTKALEECLKTANFSGKTLTGRAEEFGQDPRTREQFEGVVVRAVADLPVVLEYALPLLKVGGYLVNWMTEEQVTRVSSAHKALELLNAKIVQTIPYTLPGSTQKRYYILVQKNAPTPVGYPRAVGISSKHPL